MFSELREVDAPKFRVIHIRTYPRHIKPLVLSMLPLIAVLPARAPLTRYVPETASTMRHSTPPHMHRMLPELHSYTCTNLCPGQSTPPSRRHTAPATNPTMHALPEIGIASMMHPTTSPVHTSSPAAPPGSPGWARHPLSLSCYVCQCASVILISLSCVIPVYGTSLLKFEPVVHLLGVSPSALSTLLRTLHIRAISSADSATLLIC